MALAGVRVVFVDDGGVLNDNARRGPEWRRLIPEYLVPRLGGLPPAWSWANVGAAWRSWDRYVARTAGGTDFSGIDAWRREDLGRWLADMCEQVGVSVPPDPAALGVATATWVAERVRSEIPGAIDTVRWLSDRGLALHTASGGLSWEIEPYLRGMGIRERFGRVFGPDLVDAPKNGPRYYEAILKDTGTDGRVAVVVDNDPDPRAWAESVGLAAYPSLAALKSALVTGTG